MASPVQLVRFGAEKISVAIPQKDKLYSLKRGGLSLPAERDAADQLIPLVRKRTVSITGNLDPVGGYFLRTRGDWAYMNLPGQIAFVDKQQPVDMGGMTEEEALVAVFQSALVADEPPKITPQNPHSWGAYIERHSSDLKEWLTA
jgi:hypothetical protein